MRDENELFTKLFTQKSLIFPFLIYVSMIVLLFVIKFVFIMLNFMLQ